MTYSKYPWKRFNRMAHIFVKYAEAGCRRNPSLSGPVCPARSIRPSISGRPGLETLQSRGERLPTSLLWLFENGTLVNWFPAAAKPKDEKGSRGVVAPPLEDRAPNGKVAACRALTHRLVNSLLANLALAANVKSKINQKIRNVETSNLKPGGISIRKYIEHRRNGETNGER